MGGQGNAMQGWVYVVDDDASFRIAVERRLKQSGYEVATYGSAQELLDRLPNDAVPGCVLLDVRFPGSTGPELQARLRESDFTMPIIFLTAYTDIALTVKAVKDGAFDFLTKPVASYELLSVIERAIAHHATMYNLKGRLNTVRGQAAALTPREREVFLLVVTGKRNKQIAVILDCTERTVKAHRQRVMEKMQVRTLAELVSLAERIGLGAAGGQTTQTI